MPKFLTEDDLRKLAAKYVYDVQHKPMSASDMEKSIREAIQRNTYKVKDSDVAAVAYDLLKRPQINDRLLNETAKKVTDDSAMEDLKHMVNRNIRQLGKKGSPQDVLDIIKQAKLDPKRSTLGQINNAVKLYFASGRPLGNIPPNELHDLVKSEMSRYGPVDERDIRQVTAQYLDKADKEKPFDPTVVQQVAKAFSGRRKAPPQAPPAEEPKQQNTIKQGAFVSPQDPKNLTFFEKIRLKLRRYGIKSLTRGSRNWLTDNVSSLKRMDRKKLLAEGDTIADAFVGKMFLYFYDAKTKDKLPYWDKFPLIFVIDLYKDGWLGLNLHYLDRTIRLKLFDKLMQFANDKSLDKITRLRLTYGLLKNVSQFPEVRPCIKRYLGSYVKSELLPVAAIDWEIALFLPVEQFQKETKETVWQESKNTIRNLRKRRHQIEIERPGVVKPAVIKPKTTKR